MKNKVIRNLLISLPILFLLLVGFLLGIKKILDTSVMRDLVRNTIQDYFSLQVEYGEIDSVVFPSPGLQVLDLRVTEPGKKYLTLKKLSFHISLFSLFDEQAKIQTVLLEDGIVNVTRNEDGSFDLASKFKSDSEKFEEKKEEIAEGPWKLISLLPNQTYLRNIEIHVKDSISASNYELILNSIELLSDAKEKKIISSADLNLQGILFQSEFKIKFLKDDWKLEQTILESKLFMDQIKVSRLGDLAKVFPDVRLEEQNARFRMKMKKIERSIFEFEIEEGKIWGIKTIQQRSLDEITLRLLSEWNLEENSFHLKDTFFQWGSDSRIKLDASFDEKVNPSFVKLNLESKSLNLDSLLILIKSFQKVDLKQSKFFNLQEKSSPEIRAENDNSQHSLNIKLNLSKIRFQKYFIPELKSNMTVNSEQIVFQDSYISIFSGEVFTKGNFQLKSKRLYLESQIKNLNLENAISQFQSEKLLTGSLDSKVIANIHLTNLNKFKSSLNLNSSFKIQRGQLFGYANFVRPVAEIGKFLNYNAGNSESTSFESIEGNIHINGGEITLEQFKMAGTGLSAIGQGTYNESGKVDMKFTVSLAGIAGKAVKLPILYKGFYGKNLAYIDPIWLASVYAGSIFLGGPAGTIVGGLAGSTASETVHKSIDTMQETFNNAKSFFFGSDKSKTVK